MKNLNENVKLMKDFLDFDPNKTQQEMINTPTEVFLEIGKKKSLETFKIASKTVPAYKDFLKINKVNPENVNSYHDFQQIPLTDKNNYLYKYSIKDCLLNGNYYGKSSITSSSGSSGKPCYWPRSPIQDFSAAKGFDSYLSNTFDINKKNTLHINCSGMGVWTAGDYVTMLNRYLSYKYTNNSSISPGIDLDNTIETLCNLAPDFEQVIIYGYPPFIKDIVDNLPKNIFTKADFKLVLYGETFTENLRSYLFDKIKAPDIEHSIASILGSSEAGIVGIEEPNSIFVRRLVKDKPTLLKDCFGTDKIPTLVQFNPMAKMVEAVGSEITITALAGLPLIRFNTKDMGGTLTSEDFDIIFKNNINKSFSDLLKEKDIANTKLPFVFVGGRSDYVATIYGVNIAPEMVKDALATKELSDILSGKFVMQTKYDDNNNQYLEIILELKKGKTINDVQIISLDQKIADKLKKLCSEYGKLYDSIGERVLPKVICMEYGEKKYFSSKNKHRYLIK